MKKILLLQILLVSICKVQENPKKEKEEKVVIPMLVDYILSSFYMFSGFGRKNNLVLLRLEMERDNNFLFEPLLPPSKENLVISKENATSKYGDVVVYGKEYVGDFYPQDSKFILKNFSIFVYSSFPEELKDKPGFISLSHKTRYKENSIVDILYERKLINKKKFSILVRGEVIGRIFFGDTPVIAEEEYPYILTVPVNAKSSSWEIKVSAVLFDKSTFINTYPTVLNSAAQRIKVPKKLFKFFEENIFQTLLLKEFCFFNGKLDCDCEALLKEPPVSLIIEKKEMKISLIHFFDKNDNRCSSWLRKNEEDVFIFPAKLISVFYTEFDYEKDIITFRDKSINFEEAKIFHPSGVFLERIFYVALTIVLIMFTLLLLGYKIKIKE